MINNSNDGKKDNDNHDNQEIDWIKFQEKDSSKMVLIMVKVLHPLKLQVKLESNKEEVNM